MTLADKIRALKPLDDEAIDHLYKGMHGPIAYVSGFRCGKELAERCAKEHDDTMRAALMEIAKRCGGLAAELANKALDSAK